ncbi:membrane-bound lytic murein transglycosylase MltF [Arhodomonas sp. SL1]|uniref:membrane-bound lytic murein transglycosylase MltF n=1 Tax=Arhodomonas sp. SL1 TaxID=3425691 RepID=UPI003F8807B2
MSRTALHLSIAATLAVLLLLTALGGLRPPSQLQAMRDRGVLHVAMTVGPASYFPAEGAEPRGFEYELVAGFAAAEGVTARIHRVTGPKEATTLLENGEVDLVAATLSPTRARRARFLFTQPYLQTQPRLIHHRDLPAPQSAEDLTGHTVEAVALSLSAERLGELAAGHPGIGVRTGEAGTARELLYRAWRGHTDYAISDELHLALNRPFYPELEASMAVGGPRDIRWMLRDRARALRGAANDYLQDLRASGELALLRDEYFGHLAEFDYVGTRTFLRHITERLPPLRDAFHTAAERHGTDWRLLAAIAYQESHWDPDAVSPTGVRGLMMLTQNTADFVDIADRTDPAQSIRGGAEYLESLLQRLPEDIEPPHDTWFALAAYNVGLGHLHDARRITEMRGGDPNQWPDVRESLPLLADEQWHSRVRHGYARGWEPVRYVANIRRYYDLLRRVTEPDRPRTEPREPESLLPTPLRIPEPLESVL